MFISIHICAIAIIFIIAIAFCAGYIVAIGMSENDVAQSYREGMKQKIIREMELNRTKRND